MTVIRREMCVVERHQANISLLIFSFYPLIYGRFGMFTLKMYSSLQGSTERLCVSGGLLAHVNVCFSFLCSGLVSDRNNM